MVARMLSKSFTCCCNVGTHLALFSAFANARLRSSTSVVLLASCDVVVGVWSCGVGSGDTALAIGEVAGCLMIGGAKVGDAAGKDGAEGNGRRRGEAVDRGGEGACAVNMVVQDFQLVSFNQQHDMMASTVEGSSLYTNENTSCYKRT